MYGNAFEGIDKLVYAGLIAIVLLIVLGVFNVVHFFGPRKKLIKSKTFESKTLIVPEIKLHTDGKVIDTIYVYKFQ